MDETSSQEPTKKEDPSKSVDLSALQSFSFGTQWVEAPKQSKGSGFKPRQGGRPPRGDRPDRRQGGAPVRKDRRPPRSGGGGDRGESEDRRSGGRSFGGGRDQGHSRQPFVPYQSEVFDVCFYPDDNCFSAIIKAMRTNHLTYELFQVAKLFMEKPDRFIASVTRKAAEGEKAEKVFISAADNMPFATEDEAILHAIHNYADNYFTIEEVEIDPPSGTFAFVNRCPFTKELLGPPNYHKYEDNLLNHHRTRMANMSFEKLKGSIETVKDEEVVQEWLNSQTKTNRYTTKVEEGEEAQSFDSIEEAIAHLRTTAKDKVAKAVSYARVSGAVLEKFKDSEPFKAMNGERQRQQRFPLDTANAIRGRMRREKFSIYKRGSKGVTYVCSTKRNFRTPGQVMSPELDRIILFLEANQLIKAKEFAKTFEAWMKAELPDVAFDEKKTHRDLHWLVADGYVSHFEDDSLFAQPVLDSGNAKPAKPKAKKSTPAEAKVAESPAAAVETKAETVESAAEETSVEATPAAESEPTAEAVAEAVSEEAKTSESEAPKDAETETPAAEAEKTEVAAEVAETAETPEEPKDDKKADA